MSKKGELLIEHLLKNIAFLQREKFATTCQNLSKSPRLTVPPQYQAVVSRPTTGWAGTGHCSATLQGQRCKPAKTQSLALFAVPPYPKPTNSGSTCVTPAFLYGTETLALMTELQQQMLQLASVRKQLGSKNSYHQDLTRVTRADRRRTMEF